MNKYRINQILMVLLFPFRDPLMGDKDYLLEKYEKYEKMLTYENGKIIAINERERKLSEYQHAERELETYLVTCNEGRIKSYDDLRQLCELFHPMQELKDTMVKLQEESIVGTKNQKRELIAEYYFQKLDRIADSMITYRDGIAAIRTWNNENDIFGMPYMFDKVEIWNLLARIMIPDILIVAFAVRCQLGIECLFEQRPFISLADKILVKSLKKGIAETHLHINAGGDYATLWLYQVNPIGWNERLIKGKYLEDNEIRKIQATVFRLVAALFLSRCSEKKECSLDNWLSKKSNIRHKEVICNILEDMDYGITSSYVDIMEAMEELLKYTSAGKYEVGYDYLLGTLYNGYTELKVSSEFILLYFSYKYIKEQSCDTYFSHMFLQYLRIKNFSFCKVQQTYDVKGLRNFFNYYSEMKGMVAPLVSKEDMLMTAFRSQAQMTALKKMEIRIGPNVKFEGAIGRFGDCKFLICEQLAWQLREIFASYRRYILENIYSVQRARQILRDERVNGIGYRESWEKNRQNIQPNKVLIPQLGIVFHFLKTELIENVTGVFCWKKMIDNDKYDFGHGLAIRKYMENVSVGIECLRSKIPKLDEYIVGIDAASDENAMEPWMFVPAFIRMRSRKVSKPVGIQKNGKEQFKTIQNVGYTYHVGEDFRHILSGLRHIDEVIEHFGYKVGDRLGHAIALGIDVRNWAMENEVVALPQQEYMENLLWVWGKNVYGGVNLPIHLERLEEQILVCARKIYSCEERIYGSVEGITVKMLYDAYRKKFLVNHQSLIKNFLEEVKKGKCSDCDSGKSLFCNYYKETCSFNNLSWSADKLFCTNYCPVFEEKNKKVIFVNVLQEDIQICEELQEYLLGQVERKGIYVETNPTSNVTIGDFGEFYEHPIFRMNSVQSDGEKEHHVMVTINSDDPTIFNTNVENELAYIYYATERKGYAKEMVLQWIDKIRQNGLDSSFISKEKDVICVMTEISEILDEISYYLRNMKDY